MYEVIYVHNLRLKMQKIYAREDLFGLGISAQIWGYKFRKFGNL